VAVNQGRFLQWIVRESKLITLVRDQGTTMMAKAKVVAATFLIGVPFE